MKVFVFDPVWDSLLTSEPKKLLEPLGNNLKVVQDIKPLKECSELFEGVEERILCLNPDYVDWELKSETYKVIPNLKAIVTASTAFGWIDAEYANTHDIAIINIRNFSTESVAEWAILMMLSLARKLPLLVKNDFPLNFGSDFQTYKGVNIVGKTAGIVGLGNIGNAIAKRCAALGMDVVYWSKSPKDSPYGSVSLDELYKTADFIFPCLADNEETRKLITPEHLKSIKPSSYIVSIMHNEVHHDTVLEMVRDGRLAGYGFEEAKASNFKTYDGNVWAAPAYAWCTKETMDRSMDLFVGAIIDAANGSYDNKIN
jgi:lactate dehydrogenase-like 2-hydroxyacid dehydrogenase